MNSIIRKTFGILSIAFGLYFIFIIPNIYKELTMNQVSQFILYSIPFVFIAIGIKATIYRKIDPNTSKFYGNLSKRFLAFLIDCTILSAPYIILYFYFPAFYVLFIVITMPIIPLVSLLFLIIFEATPGKMLLGLKVLSENFERITTRQAVLRTFIDILFAIILTIGYIQAMSIIGKNPLEIANLDNYFEELQKNFSSIYNLFDTLNYLWLLSEFIVINFNYKKKAIHDYIANTVVVNVNQIRK